MKKRLMKKILIPLILAICLILAIAISAFTSSTRSIDNSAWTQIDNNGYTFTPDGFASRVISSDEYLNIMIDIIQPSNIINSEKYNALLSEYAAQIEIIAQSSDPDVINNLMLNPAENKEVERLSLEYEQNMKALLDETKALANEFLTSDTGTKKQIYLENPDDFVMIENASEKRKAIIEKMDVFKYFDFEKNQLVDAKITAAFDVTISNLFEEIDYPYYELTYGSKKAIMPAEAGAAPGQIIYTEDHTYIATISGIWQVSSGGDIKELTRNDYNGLPYLDMVEKRSELLDEERGEMIFWVDNMVINDAGDKIAYITNRDCYEEGGYSIWYCDLNTGKDNLLISGKGKFVRTVDWLDNNTLIYLQSNSPKADTFFTIDIQNGNHTELDMMGGEPHILDAANNKIAYISDFSNIDAVRIASFIDQKLHLDMVIPINGFMTINGAFDSKGENFAFYYVPYDSTLPTSVSVTNVASGTEVIVDIQSLPNYNYDYIEKICYFDNEKIVVNTAYPSQNGYDYACWMHELDNSSFKRGVK